MDKKIVKMTELKKKQPDGNDKIVVYHPPRIIKRKCIYTMAFFDTSC